MIRTTHIARLAAVVAALGAFAVVPAIQAQTPKRLTTESDAATHSQSFAAGDRIIRVIGRS